MAEHKSEMEITVWEKKCWVCGTDKGYITSHHTLPKHLKPVRNVLVPVCKRCHDIINYNDARGLVRFAYKIQQSFDELTTMVGNMVVNLTSRGKNNGESRDEDDEEEQRGSKNLGTGKTNKSKG